MSLRKRVERENATVSAESQEDDASSDRMTEEEMMALALRLSEQEASITARRLQEEEEAMKKAIQDSVSGLQSRMDTERPTTDSGEDGGQRAAGHVHRTRKRRHVEGSPLMEMPDLSQTQPQ
uniref:RAP80 N-terminal domain-containing protein n=1 Tax=Neogobius melanostomus TaxID=47308 RepID=A0A8C6WMK5_9GOBI